MRDVSTYNLVGLQGLSTKTCEICSKAFEGNPSSKYCSKTCSRKKYMLKNKFDPDFRINRLVHMAKHRAKSSGVPFDIDKDYMMELWKHNEGKCAILKIPLDLGESDLGKVNPYAPSFDRIVPSLGYTKGNVRIICYQLNVALSEFGLEQFDKLALLYVAAR